MSCDLDYEKQCLVSKVKTLLGAPVIKVEIKDEMWCNLIQLAIEEYTQYLQEWLIMSQWASLANQSLSTTDICFALTTRSLSAADQFTYAYSKQVGLQTGGKYILKKDFIIIEEGKQSYEIPAGREINEVLWLTPSEIDRGTQAAMGYGGIGGYGAVDSTGAMAMASNQSSYSLNGAYYIAPAFDILLRTMDFDLKNRMRRSDLVYKVTDGENGTKILHLLSTPNYGNSIGIRRELYGCKVWYHYYDTSNMNAAEKNKCLQTCKDIIRFPSDVPMDDIDYCNLNAPAKVYVRQFLLALAKETLGRIRGKWSGKLAIPKEDVQLEYQTLLSEASELRAQTVEKIKAMLEQLKPSNILQELADQAKALNTIQSFKPMLPKII